MERKKMAIANFNIVFGNSEEPLLSYFDTIIMPAFYKGYVRNTGDSEYSFLDIEVIETKEGEYALTGRIVKSTTLEIKSKLNEEKRLVKSDEIYSSAPYSTFVIFLRNHRMVLVKNQKGSPDLKSFASTFKAVVNKFIREENKERKENQIEVLPIPIINIVGIALRESMEEVLKHVAKINKLTLRFYPLNGDIDFSGPLRGLSTDLRKVAGSKTGAIILNSPTSVDGVVDIVTSSEGTIEPIFNVTYSDKKVATIHNGRLSENMEILIEKDSMRNEIAQILEKVDGLESITSVSEGNENIFRENKSKIISFIRRS